MTIDLLSAAGLTAAFSLLLSLIFILAPPARRWFTALEAEQQQAITGAGILMIAGVATALGCAGVIVFIPCTSLSIGEYLFTVVFAAVIGDRTSKAAFAGARWWDARSAEGQLKALTLGYDGRLLR